MKCAGNLFIFLLTLNPFIPKSAKLKTEENNFEFHFAKMSTTKKHHLKKVPLNSFHLNGHTLGFHPQTQRVQPQFINAKFDSGSERVKSSKTVVIQVTKLLGHIAALVNSNTIRSRTNNRADSNKNRAIQHTQQAQGQ